MGQHKMWIKYRLLWEKLRCDDATLNSKCSSFSEKYLCRCFFALRAALYLPQLIKERKKKGKEKEKKISCNRANKFENYYVFQNSRFLGPSVTFVQQAIKRRNIPVEELAYVTPQVVYNMLVAVFICLAFIEKWNHSFFVIFLLFFSGYEKWKTKLEIHTKYLLNIKILAIFWISMVINSAKKQDQTLHFGFFEKPLNERKT